MRTVIVMMVLMLCTALYGQDVNEPFWAGWYNQEAVDVATSMVKVRVGYELDDLWDIGFFGTYFADDSIEPGRDWGLGLFVKLTVDPNATFPVADWLPKIGDWLKLPDELEAETYLVGEVQGLPYDGDIDLMLSVGPGASVGPVFIEWLFNVVESGESDNPELTSKPVLWVGLTPLRF